MKSSILGVFAAVVSQYVIFAALQNPFPIVDKPALYELLEPSLEETLQTVSSTKETYTESVAVPRCGEILTRGYEGAIFYKPFEQVVPNERCVWIVAPPRAVGYDLNILFLGNQTNEIGTNQELIITGIRNGSGASGPTITSYKPTTTGFLNIPSANILLVTFFSGTPNGTAFGFALQYDQQRNTSAPKNSTHHIIETSILEFKYPQNSTTYNDNELAVILFSPVNNIYTGEEHLYAYKTLGLEACYDAVYLYRLNTSVAVGKDKWQYFKRLCGGDEVSYSFRSNDLSLAIFQSDISNVNSGFTISLYPGCSN